MVRDPARFFENPRAARLDGAALIVSIAGATNVLGVIVLLAASWGTIVEAGPIVASTYVLSILFGIGGVFGSWLIYSAVFHGISALFGGNGSFRTTLIYTGWGYVPIACSGLLKASLLLMTVHSASFPSEARNLGPFVQQMTTTPSFTVASVVSLVFLLWSGSLWVFAVSHARNISLRSAVITVAVPLLLWISWRLYAIL